MGLAASQARLLLLTAKNDALELQAQKIENERLILAQEQETIAQEYTEKTSNEITVCKVMSPDGTSTTSEALTIASLAKAQGGGSIVIADSNNKPLIKASAAANANNTDWDISYLVYDEDSTQMVPLDSLKDSNPKLYTKYSNMIHNFNTKGQNTPLQAGIENGGYQLLVQSPAEEANVNSTSMIITGSNNVTSAGAAGYTQADSDEFYVRKNPDSLSTVTTRYYTEDDAAAQAAYDTAMAKVNALDTRLENKLNQVETQKKAIETEMESVDQIIQTNIERTFQYFS